MIRVILELLKQKIASIGEFIRQKLSTFFSFLIIRIVITKEIEYYYANDFKLV